MKVQIIETKDWQVKKGRPVRYPWQDLQVGQSFIVPASDGKSLLYMRQTCWRWSQRLMTTFRCRALSDGGIEVARVEEE